MHQKPVSVSDKQIMNFVAEKPEKLFTMLSAMISKAKLESQEIDNLIKLLNDKKIAS